MGKKYNTESRMPATFATRALLKPLEKKTSVNIADVDRITRTIPTRAPSVHSEVLVPWLTSLVSGFFAFCLALFIYEAQGSDSSNLGASMIWGALVAMLVWFGLLWNNREYLIAREEITGKGSTTSTDGQGVNTEKGDTWGISIKRDDANQTVFLHFDTPELRLKAIQVCKLLVAGTPFSEGSLTGTGRPLTRTEFLTLRDMFFQRNVAYWKNPDQHTLGIGFTAWGKRAIRALATASLDDLVEFGAVEEDIPPCPTIEHTTQTRMLTQGYTESAPQPDEEGWGG